MTSPLLAHSFSGALSGNAVMHLRDAGVRRLGGGPTARHALQELLASRGIPASDALLDLEARAGGSPLSGGRVVGALKLLESAVSLKGAGLPLRNGRPVIPICGVPEHLEEWESPFWMMDDSGRICLFDAPYPAVDASDSIEQWFELEALAPLDRRTHVLRADAYVGALLADMLGAVPHPPATGESVSAFLGDGVWVKEYRMPVQGPTTWGSFHGTFVISDKADWVVALAPLLLDEGIGLGFQGPWDRPAAGDSPVFSFVDRSPGLGYRAEVEVTVWRSGDGYLFTAQELPRS